MPSHGAKFEHILAFAEALPALRAQVDADRRRPGLGRNKALATVVHLLEDTLIRVGIDANERQNKSVGLTTLKSRRVRIEGGDLNFHFSGKAARPGHWAFTTDAWARVVRACQDLPGHCAEGAASPPFLLSRRGARESPFQDQYERRQRQADQI